MIVYTTQDELIHELTGEGQDLVTNGSHERRVWAALPFKGEGTPLTPVELKGRVGEQSVKVGQGRAIKAGWIAKDGAGFVRVVQDIVDATVVELQTVASTGTLPTGEKGLAELRKRNLISKRCAILFRCDIGIEAHMRTYLKQAAVVHCNQGPGVHSDR